MLVIIQSAADNKYAILKQQATDDIIEWYVVWEDTLPNNLKNIAQSVGEQSLDDVPIEDGVRPWWESDYTDYTNGHLIAKLASVHDYPEWVKDHPELFI